MTGGEIASQRQVGDVIASGGLVSFAITKEQNKIASSR
jgi:hypothetical protein